MSHLIRLRLNSMIKPQAEKCSRSLSGLSDDWRPDTQIPFTLSWASLRARMREGAESTGRFSSLGGIPKYSDDSQSRGARQSHSSGTLAKILEDKQNQFHPENSFMMSLDPNSSMWQSTDQTEQETPKEKKKEIYEVFYDFYKKRTEEEKKISEEKRNLSVDGDDDGPDMKNVTVYSKLSRKRPRYGTNPNMGTSNARMHSMRNMQSGSFPEEEQTRHMHQRAVFKQRHQSEINEPEYEDQSLYKMLEKKPVKNLGRHERFQERSAQEQYYQQRASFDNKRSPLDRKMRSSRRVSEEKEEDMYSKEDALQHYSVYDDSPRASPVFTSPHKVEELPMEKSHSPWPIKYDEDSGDRKQEKLKPFKPITSSQFPDDEDSFGPSYTNITPPEPLFKPSTKSSPLKMNFMANNPEKQGTRF